MSVAGRASGQRHAKLREMVHGDFMDFSGIEDELSGYDACFFCLGVSSAGMTETEYTRVTYDITMAAARTLVKASPGDDVRIYLGSGRG